MSKGKLSPAQRRVLERLAAGGSIMYFPNRGRFAEAKASLENAHLNLGTFNSLSRQGWIAKIEGKTDTRPPYFYTITPDGREALAQESKDEQG